jgi:hypothetical protein
VHLCAEFGELFSRGVVLMPHCMASGCNGGANLTLPGANGAKAAPSSHDPSTHVGHDGKFCLQPCQVIISPRGDSCGRACVFPLGHYSRHCCVRHPALPPGPPPWHSVVGISRSKSQGLSCHTMQISLAIMTQFSKYRQLSMAQKVSGIMAD